MDCLCEWKTRRGLPRNTRNARKAEEESARGTHGAHRKAGSVDSVCSVCSVGRPFLRLSCLSCVSWFLPPSHSARDKRHQLRRAGSLIIALASIPLEILVYKRNTAPLFLPRFWPSTFISRDPQLIAKAFLRQAARSGCGRWGDPETGGENAHVGLPCEKRRGVKWSFWPL